MNTLSIKTLSLAMMILMLTSCLSSGGVGKAAGNVPNSSSLTPATLAILPLPASNSTDLVTSYSFGSVNINSVVEKEFIVGIIGDYAASSVSVDELSSGFRFKGGTYPGTGGTCGTTIEALCTLFVEFIPFSEGNKSSDITLSYNDGVNNEIQRASLALTGTGVALPKEITSFSLNGQTGTITGTSISVTMPFGTDVSSLVASFTITGASMSVNGSAQVSGVTANNFSSPVTYKVTASDGSFTNYVVTVTVASNTAKDITAFSLNGVSGTIIGTNINVTMPYGTNVTSLVAIFTTTGETVSVNSVPQVSGFTVNDFSSQITYTVTAANSSTKNYIVSVSVALNSAKDITSFSLNGIAGVITGTDIAVTMPYGTDLTSLVAVFATTGNDVSVNSVVQVSGVTANNFSSTVTYRVTAADSSTKDYAVSVTVSLNSAKDITSFSLNGTSGTIVGTSINVTMPYGTDITSLIATFSTTGSYVTVNSIPQVSGVTANNFSGAVTYTVTAADSSTKDYTVSVTVALNSAKDITVFSLNGTSGTIIGTNISVTMPYGTDLTSLIATFTTTGDSVTVNSVVQVSGVTANNFSSPVTYVVTATDSSTKNYTVSVTVALNNAKDLTSFSINGTSGTITDTNIALTLPFGTDLTSLVATFTTTGDSVTVNSVVQVSGVTANNFSSPVTYTVIAADSSTKDYYVTVSLLPGVPVTTSISVTTAHVVEVQKISFNKTAVAGAWTLSYSGTATSSLAYNISAADLQTALRAIPALSSVTATGDMTAGFNVTFNGVAGDAVLLVVASNTLTKAPNGPVSITITTPTPGVVESQTILFSSTPVVGNWQLSYNGSATASLAYNISATDFQTALRNISALSAVTVSGSVGSGFVVTFNGVAGAAYLLTESANTLYH